MVMVDTFESSSPSFTWKLKVSVPWKLAFGV